MRRKIIHAHDLHDLAIKFGEARAFGRGEDAGGDGLGDPPGQIQRGHPPGFHPLFADAFLEQLGALGQDQHFLQQSQGAACR